MEKNILPTKKAVLIFFVFACGYFISALLRAITATLSPLLTLEFNLTAGNLGLLAGGYFLGFACMQIPLGYLLDRHGPKKIVSSFLLIAIIGTSAFALAQSFSGLLISRILIGVGVSACLMGPLVYLAKKTPKENFLPDGLNKIPYSDIDINLLPNRRRNIELLAEEEVGLPLVGRIAAGQPIEAISQPEYFNFSEQFQGSDRYLLEVKGDSMIGDNICDGDFVICESSNIAKEGEIAVALVDDESATLKRIHHNKKENIIALIPSNPTLLPQEYDASRVKIQGIYLGLVRMNSKL